jgi:hypothetical protein
MMPAITSSVATAAVAPEGQGFHLNASDLRHIFKQIQIAEQHVANPGTPDNPCASLVGDGPNQIPRAGNGRELPWGLRTVDGSCNNVFPIEGRDTWGRRTPPSRAWYRPSTAASTTTRTETSWTPSRVGSAT